MPLPPPEASPILDYLKRVAPIADDALLIAARKHKAQQQQQATESTAVSEEGGDQALRDLGISSKQASFLPDFAEKAWESPKVKDYAIGAVGGAGLGGIGGYLAANKDHKLRGTLLGAGLGAAGGSGITALGRKALGLSSPKVVEEVYNMKPPGSTEVVPMTRADMYAKTKDIFENKMLPELKDKVKSYMIRNIDDSRLGYSPATTARVNAEHDVYAMPYMPYTDHMWLHNHYDVVEEVTKNEYGYTDDSDFLNALRRKYALEGIDEGRKYFKDYAAQLARDNHPEASKLTTQDIDAAADKVKAQFLRRYKDVNSYVK